MTPQDVYRCFELVLGLPLDKQAICVRIAAEASLPVWREWCRQRAVEDLSPALLQSFVQWLKGDSTDEDLSEIAELFGSSLPEDLCKEKEPAGAYAGYALVDIAMIALDKCAEVHDSVLHTAIYYAASASCGIGTEAAWVSLDRLTRPELAFLQQWWERCRRESPELAAYK